MFTYPLTLSNKEEHIEHIVKNKNFYIQVLETCNKTLEPEATAIEHEKFKEKIEKYEKEKIELQSELDTKNLELVNKNKTFVQAERLLQKTKKSDKSESAAKGKKFEEMIKYSLQAELRKSKIDCWIEEIDKTHACDIRIHVSQLGVIAIETKDKLIVSRADVEKFNRDRVGNEFTGSVFWSKTSKIPVSDDSGDGEHFLQFNETNRTLLVRGEDFQRISQLLFVYIKFLIMLKQDQAHGEGAQELVGRLFEMIISHYNSFGNLKNEIQRLDKLFLRDIDLIESLCKKHKIYRDEKFVPDKNSLYLAKQKDIRNWSLLYASKQNVVSTKRLNAFFPDVKPKSKKSKEEKDAETDIPNKEVSAYQSNLPPIIFVPDDGLYNVDESQVF